MPRSERRPGPFGVPAHRFDAGISRAVRRRPTPSDDDGCRGNGKAGRSGSSRSPVAAVFGRTPLPLTTPAIVG